MSLIGETKSPHIFFHFGINLTIYFSETIGPRDLIFIILHCLVDIQIIFLQIMMNNIGPALGEEVTC